MTPSLAWLLLPAAGLVVALVYTAIRHRWVTRESWGNLLAFLKQVLPMRGVEFLLLLAPSTILAFLVHPWFSSNIVTPPWAAKRWNGYIDFGYPDFHFWMLAITGLPLFLLHVHRTRAAFFFALLLLWLPIIAPWCARQPNPSQFIFDVFPGDPMIVLAGQYWEPILKTHGAGHVHRFGTDIYNIRIPLLYYLTFFIALRSVRTRFSWFRYLLGAFSGTLLTPFLVIPFFNGGRDWYQQSCMMSPALATALMLPLLPHTRAAIEMVFSVRLSRDSMGMSQRSAWEWESAMDHPMLILAVILACLSSWFSLCETHLYKKWHADHGGGGSEEYAMQVFPFQPSPLDGFITGISQGSMTPAEMERISRSSSTLLDSEDTLKSFFDCAPTQTCPLTLEQFENIQNAMNQQSVLSAVEQRSAALDQFDRLRNPDWNPSNGREVYRIDRWRLSLHLDWLAFRAAQSNYAGNWQSCKDDIELLWIIAGLLTTSLPADQGMGFRAASLGNNIAFQYIERNQSNPEALTAFLELARQHGRSQRTSFQLQRICRSDGVGPLTVALPATGRPDWMAAMVEAYTSWIAFDQNQIAAACYLYEIEHGKFPAGASDLSSIFQDTMPVDPVSGRHYIVGIGMRKNGIVVNSSPTPSGTSGSARADSETRRIRINIADSPDGLPWGMGTLPYSGYVSGWGGGQLYSCPFSMVNSPARRQPSASGRFRTGDQDQELMHPAQSRQKGAPDPFR